jgi:hypothetical protein
MSDGMFPVAHFEKYLTSCALVFKKRQLMSGLHTEFESCWLVLTVESERTVATTCPDLDTRFACKQL